MALFVWDDKKFSVGYKPQDDQHKKLVGILNELHDAMSAGKAEEALRKILDELVAYTTYHFSAEERLMKEHAYGGYGSHKAEHDALTKKVLSLQQKFHAGTTGLSLETSEFLKAWLMHHIQEVDKKLGPFLNAQPVSPMAVRR